LGADGASDAVEGVVGVITSQIKAVVERFLALAIPAFDFLLLFFSPRSRVATTMEKTRH